MNSVFRVLVLTDLVDSTRLVTEVGDARAAELNIAVDRISRDLLAARGGLEIDKTDGFLLLFESGSAALGYAPVAGYAQTWGAAGQVDEVHWVDVDGQPVVHPDHGWASLELVYDARGQVVDEVPRDADGQPVAPG